MNPLLDALAGPTGLKLALALLHFVWQGVLIAAVAAVLMHVVGRRSPQRRYVIGVVGMALMAVAPVVTFCLVTPPETPSIEPVPLADVSDLLVDLEQLDALLMPLDTAASDAGEIALPAVRLSWPDRLRLVQPYAVLLWLAGSLLCGLRLVVGARASVRCRRGRRSLPDAWLATVARAAERIGIRSPRVFVSDRVIEAIAVGLLRPMVLLPAAWIGRIPPDVLEAVLAHEFAHLRRHDLWVNLFQRVVESLLFYHPAVWWLSRRIRVEREYCCDETAAAAVAGRAAYARALEYVATERVAGGRTELFQAALVAGMRGGDSMALLNRVRRVLGVEDRPPFRPRLSEGLLALAVPVALWAGIATVGPALAQEETKEPAEATIPTVEVEDALRDDVLIDLANGEPADDAEREMDPPFRAGTRRIAVGPGVYADEAAEAMEAAADAAASRDSLHDAIRELREELKALRSEVEELRSDTKQGRSTSDHFQGLWPDYMAAWKVRDEAYRQVLRVAKAQDEDPTYVRFVRERYHEAETRLAELHERIEQIDPKLLESKGVNYRVVTESVLSEDGTTREIKRMVRVNETTPDDGSKPVAPPAKHTTEYELQAEPGSDGKPVYKPVTRIRKQTSPPPVKASVGGQTKPSAEYLRDDIQYFPSPPDVTSGKPPVATTDDRRDDGTRLLRALDKPVRLSFHETPLRQVVETLRNITQVDFLIDARGLAEEGLSLDAPVTAELYNVTVRSALPLILKPLNLGYTVDDSVIRITSIQRTKGPLVVETYVVADLVGPELPILDVLSPEGRRRTMEVSPELKQQLATRIDMLIDVITGTIEPGSWENVGGWGAIRQSEATHSLVVRQTRDVHEQVHNLLAQLRSARRGDYGPLRSDINRMHKTQPPTDKPGEKSPLPAAETTSVKVRVEQAGTYYVDGYAASATGLASAIKEAMAEGDRAELVIQADQAAPFSAVVPVVEAAKEVGVEKIRFATRPRP